MSGPGPYALAVVADGGLRYSAKGAGLTDTIMGIVAGGLVVLAAVWAVWAGCGRRRRRP